MQPAPQRKPTAPNRNLIKGPILPALLSLSVPIVIGQLFQTAYNVIDTIWVGRLGAEAVAAISMSFPIVFFLISIAGGLTIAGTALIAQHVGAGNREAAGKVATQMLVAVLGLAIVLAAAGFLLSGRLLSWMGADDTVLPLARSYLNFVLAGLPFMFLSFNFASILRGIGDAVTPMKMRMVSVVLNAVLDPLFIFGWLGFPQLGVAGAGAATIIARAVEGVWGLYILTSGSKGIRINFQTYRPDWGMIRKLFTIGSPAAVEQSTRSLGMGLMMSIVALSGTATVAAYGIGTRILSVAMLPSFGVGMATTTLVGQSLGAGKPQRAETATWLALGVTFSVLTAFGLLVAVFPRTLITVFSNDPDVLRIGASFLRTVGPAFGFLGGLAVVGGGFRGAGDTVPSMTFALLSLLGLQVPLAYLLSQFFGLGTQGIWWAMVTSGVIGTVSAALWFRRGGWKLKSVTRPHDAHTPSVAVGAASE